MTEIICAVVAAAASIICAIVGKNAKKRDEEIVAQNKLSEERAVQRAKEGRLQLAMISANTKLTVGVAMALKHGRCNGEVESGLKAVEEANAEYTAFLEGIAIDSLVKT